MHQSTNTQGVGMGVDQGVKGSSYLLTCIKHFKIMTINVNTSIMYWVRIRSGSKYEKLSETGVLKNQQLYRNKFQYYTIPNNAHFLYLVYLYCLITPLLIPMLKA